MALNEGTREIDDIGIEAPCQAAVGGNENESDFFDLLPLG